MRPKWFTLREVEGLRPELVDRLDWAREKAGVPFVITSGFRPGDPRAHGRGWAVDLRCWYSRPRFKILGALLEAGFRRVGVYDKHIHADLDPDLPQEVIWMGVSE